MQHIHQYVCPMGKPWDLYQIFNPSLIHSTFSGVPYVPYGGSTVQGVGVGLWCGVASAGSGNLITFNSLPYMYLRKYIQ
jgi:hypothetical protein